MKYPHWEYYLTLVEDIDAISRFIHPCPENFKTFSIELTRLLLSIGSEIDVVCKVLCQEVDSSSSPKHINHYKDVLLKKYPDIPSIEVSMPKYGISRTPWSQWSSATNPTWWADHNHVKHNRHNRFKEANLINVIDAAGALCVLVAYLYHDFFSDFSGENTFQRPFSFLADGYQQPRTFCLPSRYVLPEFRPPTTQ
ncbi:MAG: hypothetical protein KAG97_10040 [Victivallales bacterium]|nr:hypothetical protein [Victivallales bacterium]